MELIYALVKLTESEVEDEVKKSTIKVLHEMAKRFPYLREILNAIQPNFSR
jgi:hypothetical protein